MFYGQQLLNNMAPRSELAWGWVANFLGIGQILFL